MRILLFIIFKLPSQASFSFIFVLFKQFTEYKLLDSNSDHWSRRRVCWPPRPKQNFEVLSFRFHSKISFAIFPSGPGTNIIKHFWPLPTIWQRCKPHQDFDLSFRAFDKSVTRVRWIDTSASVTRCWKKK